VDYFRARTQKVHTIARFLYYRDEVTRVGITAFAVTRATKTSESRDVRACTECVTAHDQFKAFYPSQIETVAYLPCSANVGPFLLG